MRVATLFKRLLRLGGERVVGVKVEDGDGIEQVVVEVALRARRALRCSGCGGRVRGAYDSRVMSWRHLDLGRVRCVIRCEVRRVECSGCGVRVEAVPWARAGSHRRDGRNVRLRLSPRCWRSAFGRSARRSCRHRPSAGTSPARRSATGSSIRAPREWLCRGRRDRTRR